MINKKQEMIDMLNDVTQEELREFFIENSYIEPVYQMILIATQYIANQRDVEEITNNFMELTKATENN